jgi:hypothetical protein
LESEKSPLVALVIKGINDGVEAVDRFSEAIALIKPAAQEPKISEEETLSAAQAATLRRAFNKQARRVDGLRVTAPNGDRLTTEPA